MSSIQAPEVSVVMSVFNGSRHLEESINSILEQSCQRLELIVVDDGSTDGTPQILRERQSQDTRLRIISQQNAGLTNALNRGCREARAPVIARQDVGDISHRDRLQRQLDFLGVHPEVVAVGVGSRRIGPEGEFLGEVTRQFSPRQVTDALRNDGVGLLHAAAAFRKTAFEKVGGYRSEFRFAQDTDLWYRLSTIGLLAELPEVLFSVRIELNGISGRQTNRQIALADLARRCHVARIRGESDGELIREAESISRTASSISKTENSSSNSEGDAAYFLGSQLLDRRDSRCRKYLARAVKHSQQRRAAAMKLLASYFLCSATEPPQRSAANGAG